MCIAKSSYSVSVELLLMDLLKKLQPILNNRILLNYV